MTFIVGKQWFPSNMLLNENSETVGKDGKDDINIQSDQYLGKEYILSKYKDANNNNKIEESCAENKTLMADIYRDSACTIGNFEMAPQESLEVFLLINSCRSAV